MIRMSAEEARNLFGGKKAPKYRNRQCVWKGEKFDSILERDRFIILEAEQAEGRIQGLRRQVKYTLIPAQKIDGKTVERECSYIADFVYSTPAGEVVCEDTKGFRTKEWIIKRKLMLYIHGIRVREIGRKDT